jgi:hypothetical protein
MEQPLYKEQQHMTIQQTDQMADDPEPTDNVWSSITMTQFNGCQIQQQPTNSNNNKYKDLIVLDPQPMWMYSTTPNS